MMLWTAPPPVDAVDKIQSLGLARWARPDVACLKATDSEFPVTAIKKAGYGAVWCGEKSWNGVAILGRNCEPVVIRTELPGDPADTQSRYIEAAVNGVRIATLYAPNGNAAGAEIQIQARPG